MKKYLLNILIAFIFLICLIFMDYIFIIISKTNYYNYQNNNLDALILKQENQTLKNELNNVLSLNNLDKYQDYDYLKSKIVLRDVYHFHNSITILYGQDQNIKKGMAVVSENGLIGLISKVNQKTSTVKLITSNNLNISIKIGEEYGMLNKYDLAKNNLIAQNFNNYELIMKNEEVYTSGLGLIPPGLYIGKVNNTNNKDIEQVVSIKSDVNFNDLKYVAIIRGLKDVN